MSIASRVLFVLLSVLCSLTLRAACDNPVLTQKPDVVVGYNPLAVALADFDKDGKLDIATPRNTDGTAVWVQKGNGDGTFQTGIPYPSGTVYAVRLIAADMNNDTWPDLVTANYDTNNISVLLNDGDGTFAAAQVTASVAKPARVVAAHVNTDGYLDIAVVGISDSQVHYGNGNGTFNGTGIFQSDGIPHDFAFGDFDGSGTTDVAVYGQPWHTGPDPAPPSSVKVHFRAANGTYSSTSHPLPGHSYGILVAEDLNADGKDDLVAGNAVLENVSVFVRSGNGFNRTDYDAGSAEDSRPNELGFADINEDGKSDLIAAMGNSTTFVIFLSNGDGTLDSALHTDVVASQYFLQHQGLGLGDLDGDFRTDILLVDSSTEKGSVFKNGCSPRFSATAVASSPNPSSYSQSVTLNATIAVTGTTNPTGTVSFYEGASLLGTGPVTPATRTASIVISGPTIGVHSYTATYSGDSEFSESTSPAHSHTVTPPPFGTPWSFSATGNPANGEVSMQWIGTQDVAFYEVLRMSGGSWEVIGTTAATVFPHAAGTGSWFYGVRGVTSGDTRSDEAVDAASTVAFTYTAASGTNVHAADLTELRTIVAGLRASAGIGGVSFTDPSLSGALIKAAHQTELRSALSDAMTEAGMAAPTFDRSITTGLVVLANDVLEMRGKVR